LSWGGPTPDKPSVTLSVSADPGSVSSFMNIRVADIQACYELWRRRTNGRPIAPVAPAIRILITLSFQLATQPARRARRHAAARESWSP
jgi:hypothetical protein